VILDLLCEKEVYGPKGNAAALEFFGEDVEVLALTPQAPELTGKGEWDGVSFQRISMPTDISSFLKQGISALIISGSRSNITQPEEWMEGCAKFIRQVVEYGVPTLGICFGHQLLAYAFGGELERQPESFDEISSIEIIRTDRLFEGCFDRPKLLFTHQDQVVLLPQRLKLLASAPHAPIAAFRVHTEGGISMKAWGVQFHPESTPEICRYASAVGDMPFAEDDKRIDELSGSKILQNFARLALNKTPRVVVLTGAGISEESGIKTFRDNDGLWENHRLEDVASPLAWQRNAEMVWRFYQARRSQLLDVEPNSAHYALAELENKIDSFTLITQNVDDLHSRAGSKNMVQMHGQLRLLRCEVCSEIFEKMRDEDLEEDFIICQCKKGILRPHIVWFGEEPLGMMRIKREIRAADILIVIGTSGVVYPANSLLPIAKSNGAYCIGINLEPPVNIGLFDEFHQGKAGEVLPELVENWLQEWSSEND
jgi:NAD-dependent deacetylase